MSGDRIERGRTAWRGGVRAEWVAAWLLRLKGYRILAKRLRTPAGEIDLLAARGDTLVVVEVKARARGAEAALQPRQQERLRRAATFIWGKYAQRYPTLRFDVVVVNTGVWGAGWPRHFPAAFEG